jgi:hypothetical protein
MKIVALIGTAFLLVISAASATDLTNKDSTSYDIEVWVDGSSSSQSSSFSSNTQRSICASYSDTCKVSVSGVGEIEVSGSEDIVISGGSLSID